MRDKTKNHIVNQKKVKNKTRNTHKKKLTAKEKLKININKQEPETKKKSISLIANPLPANLVFDHTSCQGEYYHRHNPRYVALNWHRHFFGLRLVRSLSLCRNGGKLPCDGIWQELQAEKVLQFPSIGFGLSPQFGQGHIQTLRCTKKDKIINNCPSCRTHMAIVILQEKNVMKFTLP